MQRYIEQAQNAPKLREKNELWQKRKQSPHKREATGSCYLIVILLDFLNSFPKNVESHKGRHIHFDEEIVIFRLQ